MVGILDDAQVHSLVFAVIGDAGCGKSEAVRSYCIARRQNYHLVCSEFWNRKHFLSELLLKMGVSGVTGTVADMMQEVVSTLKRQESPLLVLDEADKLNDHVLYFFISLYNQPEDHVGIVLTATDFLEKRIKSGVRQNRKGFKEIFSQVGRKFSHYRW